MMKRKRLLIVFLLSLCLNATILSAASPAFGAGDGMALQEGNELYLYNIGAAKYVNFSGQWGTYYSMSESGMPLEFVKVEGEDTWNIKTLFDGSNNYLYSHTNNTNYAFDDGNNTEGGEKWVFENVSGNVYRLKNNMTGYYMTAYMDDKGGLMKSSVDASDDNAKWIIVSKTMMEEKLLSATSTNPVDASFLIKDANFIYNSSERGSWTGTNVIQPNRNATTAEYRAYEFFGTSNGKIVQTITFPKAGTYELSVQAFQRGGSIEQAAQDRANGEEKRFTVLFAGNRASYVQSIFDEAGNNGTIGVESAYGYIPNSLLEGGMYFWDETLYRGSDNKVMFYVAEDNATLEIGLEKQGGEAYWAAFDNFRMAYYGEENLVALNDATPPAGNIYLYNVSTGKYINQGDDYGTRAMLEKEGGLDMNMEQDGTGYSFATKVGFSDTNYLFHDDNGTIWADGDQNSQKTFRFAETGVAGTYYIYYLAGDDMKMLAVEDNGQTVSANRRFIVNDNNDAFLWQVHNKSDRVAALDNAGNGVGVDATFYIEDPDFAFGNQRISSWLIDDVTRSYDEWSSHGKAAATYSPHYTAWLNECADSKNVHGDVFYIRKYSYAAMNRTDYGTVKQNIEGLKPGVYVLSCEGLYSDGNVYQGRYMGPWNDGYYERRAFLFVNDNRVALRAIADPSEGSPVGVADNDYDDFYAGEAFYNGRYSNSVPVIVGNDGKLSIGIDKQSRRAEDWAAFDKLRLTYYGAADDANALKEAFKVAYATAQHTYSTFVDHSDPTADELNELSNLVSGYESAPSSASDLLEALNKLNSINKEYDEAVIAYAIYKSLLDEYNNGDYAADEWPYASETLRTEMDAAFSSVPSNKTESLNAIHTLRAYVESNAMALSIDDNPESRNYTSDEHIINADLSEGATGWTVWGTAAGFTSPETLLRGQAFPRDSHENRDYAYLSWAAKPIRTTFRQSIKNLLPGKYIITMAINPSENCQLTFYEESYLNDQLVNRSVKNLPVKSGQGGTYTNGWYDTWFVANIINKDEEVVFSLTINGGTQWNWATADVANVRVYKIEDPAEFILDEDKTVFDYDKDYTDAKCVLHRSFDINKWNSLILPIDLTYEQFVNAFGEDARLAKIEGLDENCQTTIVFNEQELGVNKLAIQAGTHYIIYPTKEADQTTGTYTSWDETTVVPAPLYYFDNISMKKDVEVSDTCYYTNERINNIFYNGTFVKRNIPAGSYAFSRGDLYHISSSLPLKGFRCWIEDYTEAQGVKNSLSFTINQLDGETATIIEGVELSNSYEEGRNNDIIYNLSGQVVGQGLENIDKLQNGVYIVNGKKIVVRD